MQIDIVNMEPKKDQIQTIDDSQHDQECLTNSEPGWEKEALSVIKDVQDHVKSIDISKVIKVINHNKIKIYFSFFKMCNYHILYPWLLRNVCNVSVGFDFALYAFHLSQESCSETEYYFICILFSSMHLLFY